MPQVRRLVAFSQPRLVWVAVVVVPVLLAACNKGGNSTGY